MVVQTIALMGPQPARWHLQSKMSETLRTKIYHDRQTARTSGMT